MNSYFIISLEEDLKLARQVSKLIQKHIDATVQFVPNAEVPDSARYSSLMPQLKTYASRCPSFTLSHRHLKIHSMSTFSPSDYPRLSRTMEFLNIIRRRADYINQIIDPFSPDMRISDCFWHNLFSLVESRYQFPHYAYIHPPRNVMYRCMVRANRIALAVRRLRAERAHQEFLELTLRERIISEMNQPQFLEPVVVPLSETLFNELPRTKTVSDLMGNCSICLDTNSDDSLELPCHHYLHFSCAKDLFATTTKCPLCRADVRDSLNQKTEKIPVAVH